MSTTPQQLIEVVKNTIMPVKFCFLITLDEDGTPSVRLMQHFSPEEDLTIWFGTHPESRKVNDIKRDSRVTIAFHNEPQNAYVTFKGTARVENKLDKRQALWYDDWSAFFVGGPKGDAYTLIEFTPHRIELMNFAENVAPPPFGIKSADLVKAGDTWQVEYAG